MDPEQIYHIYNRGIDHSKIFYEDANYDYFVKKVEKYICSCSELLGYCLMPNHFHLLIRITEESIVLEDREYPRMYPFMRITALSAGIKTLLSSYARAINHQEGRNGSLFKQNTRMKLTGTGDIDSYAVWCLHYLHLNPVRSGLVTHPSEWPWSSYNEYFGSAKKAVCDTEVGREALNLDVNDLEVHVPRL